MNTLFNINKLRNWLLFLAFILPVAVFAEEDTGDVDDAESAAMAKTKANAPVMQETDPTGANYLSNRRALVGKHCAVNRVINIVAVGSGTSGLENLTNEDIDDYASFPSVVSATVATSPTVSVRDMKYYYAAGTDAGFCIVASSGSSVLSLDLVKTYHIWFYCDGKRVDDQQVSEGNSGSGVGLSLIGIPGSDQACTNLTATSTKKFDEVALVQVGAVDASVGSEVKIKYAFVGKANDINLTKKSISEYCTAIGHPAMTVSCEAFMPSPLVGGIPIPMAGVSENKVIGDDDNERLDESIAIVSAVQLASVAFSGRVRVNVTNSDASVSELFHKGDQVGFKYTSVQVANLVSLGAWIDIKLYDHNGNGVQTTTINADVLKLSLASGGDFTSYIVAEQDFSGAEITFYTALGVLNLGSGFGVYYAFVRQQPTIDHECDINPTADTNLCSSQTSLQLKSNPNLNVTWTVESQPQENSGQCSVTADGYVTGMIADGEYKFRATSEDGCYEILTINHANSETFLEESPEHVFLASDGYELATDLHGQTSANVLSISDMTDSENILDGDLSNYATYVAGLQLAGANGILVGIKKTDGTYFYDGSLANSADEVQVGFVVELEQTAIGLDLLNTFQIRCFDENGNKLYQSLVDNAGVLGLGLIGNNDKSNKIRMSITVPKVNGDGQPVKINEIQLWKVGVLDLDVDDMKYYYGFWADPSDKRNNVVRDGATVVTYDNMGAMVNVATQIDIAAVGCVTNNLSNIIDIDDELETYALVQKTVNSGSQEIVVKLGRTLDYRHQVGVVIDKDIVGLTANLGNVVRIGTYYNGQDTGEMSTSWNVLGANVIQGDGKAVLYLQPTTNYDEIHITLGGGLQANQTMKIYGILLRNDIDNDGTPDVRDTESCTDGILNIVAAKVCKGETLTITGLGTTETDYFVSVPDQGVEKQAVQSGQDGTVTVSATAVKSGRFTVYFYDASENLISTADYTVHPSKTTWRANTISQDWNSWDNWTEGTPYLCTDVIIPANARSYPSLDEDVVRGDEFGCDRIYFENRAAVEKVYKLNYSQAWVDVELEPNRYYLMASPLQDMYTGDMFIPTNDPIQSKDDYFTELNGDNYVQNRFSPRVYQRLWAKAADVKLSDGTMSEGAAIVQETQWSKRFNALKYAYGKAEGFSLWIDPESNTAESFTFRFPKQQTAYNYFSEVSQTATDWQETDISRSNAHRFTYEIGNTPVAYTYKSENDRMRFDNLSSMNMTVSADQATKTFLIGNPFMSHIDVEEFLSANTGITEVKAYDGNTTSSTIAVGGELISTNPDFTTIEPMEAFYVSTASAQTSLEVTFTEDMFKRDVLESLETTSDNDGAAKSRIQGKNTELSMMRINVKNETLKTSALVLGEGNTVNTETLFDEDAKPQLAIFTVSEGHAYDILSLNNKGDLPIGIYAQGEQSITLSFDFMGEFDSERFELVDNLTGETYSLDEVVTVDIDGSSIARFCLRDKSVTGIEEVGTDESKSVFVTFNGQTAEIHSQNNDIIAVELYTADGQLVNKVNAGGVADIQILSDLKMGIINIIRQGMPNVSHKFILP